MNLGLVNEVTKSQLKTDIPAFRSGSDTILIPKENVKDLDDVHQEVKDAVTFIPCSNVSQVLHNALVK